MRLVGPSYQNVVVCSSYSLIKYNIYNLNSNPKTEKSSKLRSTQVRPHTQVEVDCFPYFRRNSELIKPPLRQILEDNTFARSNW